MELETILSEMIKQT